MRNKTKTFNSSSDKEESATFIRFFDVIEKNVTVPESMSLEGSPAGLERIKEEDEDEDIQITVQEFDPDFDNPVD